MSTASSPPPLALVTGGNRGLGHETCRQLAAAGWRVLLAARDSAQAAEAADALAEDAANGGAVEPITLDVGSDADVAAAVETLRGRGEPLQALVNNAGIALQGFDADIVHDTMAVNVHGPARVTDALRPLLAPHASVVMVSSGMGDLSILSTALAQRFLDPALTREGVFALMDEFEQAVRSGEQGAQGWPSSAYSVSKAALNALTRVIARDPAYAGQRVNAVCPGWVRTAMGGRGADRSVAEGARGIAWAAMLPPDGPTGGFFRDGKPIDW